MIKTLLIIILLFNITSFGEEAVIPLPPISPKQEASIKKERSKISADPAPITTIKRINKERQKILNIKRLILGVVQDGGDLYLPLTTSLCLTMNEVNSKACRVKQYQDNNNAVRGLINGEIDLLITNSLVVKDLMQEMPPFNDKIDKSRIRFVNYFFSEAFLAFSKKENSLQNLSDLQARPINSSSESLEKIIATIRKNKGWTSQVTDSHFTKKDQIISLCNGSIKVASFLAELLNQEVKDITKSCQVNVIKFSQEEITQMTKDMGFFPYRLPGGIYLGLPEATDTIAIKAVALTTSDLTDSQAKFFLDNLVTNLPSLQKLHVALGELTFDNTFANPLFTEHEAVKSFKDQRN